MLDYLKSKRGKSPAPTQEAEAPVLTQEDEEFLHRIATEGTPPALPERPLGHRAQPDFENLHEVGNPEGNDAQIALYNEAQNTPLPDVPETPEVVPTIAESNYLEAAGAPKGEESNKKSKWSWLRRDSREAKRKATATGLMSAAENLKSPDAQSDEEHIVSDPEARKEEAEMSDVLEQLNLAAVDNRVFSISKESQELLGKFTLVLKDLINGVPTAYGDLESLLTNSEDQIQRSYKHLPPWLQKLVEQLPDKMTKSIGPEMLAAAAEKHGMNSKYANMAAHGAEKAGIRVKVPSLKDLVTKPGAVAGLLKTIMNFLKLRFPAFLGMNVLYSLALFVLLLVFWYCHKRGREVRLEKERLLTEEEVKTLDEDAPVSSSTKEPTTTAPEGASMEEVQAGMLATQVADGADPRSTSRMRSEGRSSQSEVEQLEGKGKRPEFDIRVFSVESVQVRPSSAEHEMKLAEKQRKQQSKAERWKHAPSAAPLESQESCVLC